MKRISLSILLILSLVLYYFFNIYNTIPYFKSKGSSFNNGYKFGKEFKNRVKIMKYMSDLLLKIKKRKNITLKIREYEKYIDKSLKDEIRGIAQGAELKYEDILQINCFLELSSLTVFGCYQTAIANKEKIIHGRNLDWNNYFRIFNKFITFYEVEEKDKNRVFLITFPGMVGAISGINDKKMSIAFNYRKCPAKYGYPIFLLLRKVLNEASSIEESIAILKKHKSTLDYLVTVVDGKTKKSVVVENRDGEIRSRSMVDNILLCDNDYICFMDNRKQENFDQHKKALESSELNIEKIKSILKMDYELKPLNLYSYIYDATNNDFYIANGQVPACEKSEYRKIKILQ